MNCLNRMCDEAQFNDGEEIELFSVSYGDEYLSTKYKGVADPVNDIPHGITVAFRDESSDSKRVQFREQDEASVWMKVNLTAEKSHSTAAAAGNPSHTSQLRSNNLTEPPYGLPATNFLLNGRSYDNLMVDIDSYLNASEDYDFSYVTNDNMWRGKHLSGSGSVEMELNLYYSKQNDTYTVSVVKSSSSGFPHCSFQDFYQNLRTHFTGEPAQKRRRLSMSTTALPLPSAFLSVPTGAALCIDEGSTEKPAVETGSAWQTSEMEFMACVQPIFHMAEETALVESRLEAARMLFDLSTKDSSFLGLPVLRQQCLATLETLMRDTEDDIRQIAVLAVASFAELSGYQQSLIDSEVLLPDMFNLVENCVDTETAYASAQIRRSAASVLALLSRAHPYQVRTQLQLQHGCDVDGWIRYIVPSLRDTKTKAYAKAAADALVEVCMGNNIMLPIGGSAASSSGMNLGVVEDDFNFFSVLHSLG